MYVLQHEFKFHIYLKFQEIAHNQGVCYMYQREYKMVRVFPLSIMYIIITCMKIENSHHRISIIL